MQTIAWLVAALVIMINGYLLLEFFSSEVSGVLYTGFVTMFTASYGAFIVYLIARGIDFTPWRSKAESSR